jgi:hypothetical protein
MTRHRLNPPPPGGGASSDLPAGPRAWPLRVGRLQARRMGVRPQTIDSSHSPFLSQPPELAQLLVHAVDTTPIGPLIPGDK